MVLCIPVRQVESPTSKNMIRRRSPWRKAWRFREPIDPGNQLVARSFARAERTEVCSKFLVFIDIHNRNVFCVFLARAFSVL